MAPRNRPKHHNALIVCTPGLEEVVLDELDELGVKTATRDGKGAVIATLSTRELYAANALLRSATRILVRAFSFRAETFAGLESEIQRLDWSPYVSDQPLRFHVSSHSSALYHTKAIQERLQRWVPSGPPNDDPALRVVVRAVDDIFTVRVDTSGDELYRRGWRPESAKMGLRESVAAAVVRRSGWDQASPLLDPCCGAGTVAIEAALQAAGAPPHDLERRGFALQLWPSFDERAWDAVEDDVAAKAEAARAAPAAAPLVFASDRDAGAVRAARANARRAGVADRIEFRQEPVTEAGARAAETAAAAGTLATNLPWGLRSAEGAGRADLRNLYSAVGNVARRSLPRWGVAVLVANRALARNVAPKMKSALSMEVSGVKSWLMTTARRAKLAE